MIAVLRRIGRAGGTPTAPPAPLPFPTWMAVSADEDEDDATPDFDGVTAEDL